MRPFPSGAASTVAILLALGAVPNDAVAQTSAEQQCYDMVQGRVAWNTQGSTNWVESNVRSLCLGVAYPSARIECFSERINAGADWAQAIAQCQSAGVSWGSSTEAQCANMVQGRVAWNTQGSTNWVEANVRSLCRGVVDPSARIGCFGERINAGADWARAIEECQWAGASWGGSAEAQCADMVQGRVAWNQQGTTAWIPSNVSELCRGVGYPQARITCFSRMVQSGTDWPAAIATCREAGIEPQDTVEARCASMVQDRVPWNQQGATSWDTANIQSLCSGTTQPSQRIACFTRQINAGQPWQTATQICVARSP